MIAVKAADNGFPVGGAVVIPDALDGCKRHIIAGNEQRVHTLRILLHDSLHRGCRTVGLRVVVLHLEHSVARLLHGAAVAVQARHASAAAIILLFMVCLLVLFSVGSCSCSSLDNILTYFRRETNRKGMTANHAFFCNFYQVICSDAAPYNCARSAQEYR